MTLSVDCAVTVTVPFPETAPSVAVTKPLPLVVVCKVSDVPLPGLSVPPATVVVHEGLMLTGLPYASAPAAVNNWAPPSASVTEEGDTLIVFSGPAETVVGSVPEPHPEAEAVMVGLPAVVSS